MPKSSPFFRSCYSLNACLKITKAISQFLAQNRAKNDASNRAEFLESLAQKRRRLNIDPESTEHIPSCARTDAKPLDRDSQMKYDIAKNEDGPLRRTVKGLDGKAAKEKEKLAALADDTPSELQPGIDGRLKNIESHVAVRYGNVFHFFPKLPPLIVGKKVPAPPRTLLARLQFLEDHIIQLEKEYPPWAALHFNQPNRGVSNCGDTFSYILKHAVSGRHRRAKRPLLFPHTSLRKMHLSKAVQLLLPLPRMGAPTRLLVHQPKGKGINQACIVLLWKNLRCKRP